MSAAQARRRDERGSTLILALAFVFAVGLIILALATFTSDSMLNTSNARAQRTSLNDAETATVTAVQYLRDNFAGTTYNLQPANCLPSGASLPSSDPRASGGNISVSLWCVANYNPGASATRVVDFYACQFGTSGPACTAPGSTRVILHAQVAYNDYPTSGPASCSATSEVTCGTAMSVTTWDITSSDT